MFTDRSPRAYVVGPLHQLGDANATKITWRFKKGYYHRHHHRSPNVSKCSSNAHHQMYPKYPWKTIMVFFQHSASHGNNIGLFKPKERHTSLHRWPYQKHSEDKVWKSRGKIFCTNLLKVYYIKSLYIYTWIIIYLMHLVLFHYNNTFRIIYHKCFIIVSYMYGTVYISSVFLYIL